MVEIIVVPVSVGVVLEMHGVELDANPLLGDVLRSVLRLQVPLQAQRLPPQLLLLLVQARPLVLQPRYLIMDNVKQMERDVEVPSVVPNLGGVVVPLRIVE